MANMQFSTEQGADPEAASSVKRQRTQRLEQESEGPGPKSPSDRRFRAWLRLCRSHWVRCLHGRPIAASTQGAGAMAVAVGLVASVVATPWIDRRRAGLAG